MPANLLASTRWHLLQHRTNAWLTLCPHSSNSPTAISPTPSFLPRPPCTSPPHPSTVYRCTEIGIPDERKREWYTSHFGSVDGSERFRALRLGLRLVAKEV